MFRACAGGQPAHRRKPVTEQRGVIKAILEGARHRFSVAAAEIGFQDRRQRALLAPPDRLVVASSRRRCRRSSCERLVWSRPEIEVLTERRWLELTSTPTTSQPSSTPTGTPEPARKQDRRKSNSNASMTSASGMWPSLESTSRPTFNTPSCRLTPMPVQRPTMTSLRRSPNVGSISRRRSDARRE